MISQLRFVCNHPLCRRHRIAALRRVLAWQIRSRLMRSPAVVPFTARTRLRVTRGMTGATGNIYCGLHEFEDMAFVLHLLRPDDLFADVGANVGSYTVLASGHAGARTAAFEPVPDTFHALNENVKLNALEPLVTLHRCGVGTETGTLRFTTGMDTMNHVADDLDHDAATRSVNVHPLDNLLQDDVPLCIKIDVEGFETNVLRGASRTLASPLLRAILMELNGSGKRYGFDDDELRQEMRARGFTAFTYEPFSRQLHPLSDERRTSGNTLFLRDLPFVQARLAVAEPIELPWITVPTPKD